MSEIVDHQQSRQQQHLQSANTDQQHLAKKKGHTLLTTSLELAEQGDVVRLTRSCSTTNCLKKSQRQCSTHLFCSACVCFVSIKKQLRFGVVVVVVHTSQAAETCKRSWRCCSTQSACKGRWAHTNLPLRLPIVCQHKFCQFRICLCALQKSIHPRRTRNKFLIIKFIQL